MDYSVDTLDLISDILDSNESRKQTMGIVRFIRRGIDEENSIVSSQNISK